MSNVEKYGASAPIPPQPKAMYLIVAVQMWESFSYYGMRAILVLYMISVLNFEDSKAYGIYALYMALVEGLGIFGGKLADRYLGLRNAIYIGGTIIAFGHTVLSLSLSSEFLYVGLAMIAVGSGLFKTNCSVLLGEFYEKEDPRKDAGYVYYYVGLNLGAMLATVGCAYTAQVYGWHVGFSLAGFGMLLGLLTLLKFRNVLAGKGRRPINVSKLKISKITIAVLASIPFVAVMLYFFRFGTVVLTLSILVILANLVYSTRGMTVTERGNIYSILMIVMLIGMFYGFEEQVGSSLVVFAERYSDLMIFGFKLPASSINSINPLVILLIGPMIGYLIEYYEAKAQRRVNVFSKIAVAFILQGIAFAGLCINTLVITGDDVVSGYAVGLTFAMLALSELFIGPAAYAHCASVAPKNMKGVMMGTIMLGFSLANLFSGAISQVMAISDENADLGITVYSDCFMHIAITCIITAALIYLFQFIKLAKRRRRT